MTHSSHLHAQVLVRDEPSLWTGLSPASKVRWGYIEQGHALAAVELVSQYALLTVLISIPIAATCDDRVAEQHQDGASTEYS